MKTMTRRGFVCAAGTAAAAVAAGKAGVAKNSGGMIMSQTSQDSNELGFLTATELAARLATGDVGSEELTRHFIVRIERYDDELNAVVVRDFERALDDAKEADRARSRGESLGRLHGLPMTIKESYDIAGLPSTWGHPAAAKSKAQADSVVVERFKNEGALFLGKTNVPVDLGDYQSYNEVYGTTNNPWDKTRTPGGSSGGSAAALAAGLTGLESGSDIGGSIRNPAHFCGVYGHKPTLGIVPSRGHQPVGVPPSPQDPDLAVVGPMARSAEDLALALDIVAGPDVLQAPGWRLDLPAPRASSLGDLRVALWPDDEMAPVAGEVADRVARVGEVLSKRGATVSDKARPGFAASASHETYMPILGGMTRGPEAQLRYAEWMALNGRRGFFRSQWQQFFEEWDVLICPIAVTPAFLQDQSQPLVERVIDVDGDEQPYFQQLFWAGLATLSYLPSTVFPTGLSESGLPIGLQAIGAEFDDRTTIEFARLIESELGGYVPPPGYSG